MTLTFRNGLLTTLLIVTGLLAAGYGVAIFLLFSETEFPVLLEAAPGLIIGLAGLGWLRRVYRKTSAPPVFFFAVFLFCLAGETIRVAQLFLNMGNVPFSYGILLTKIVWAFRLTALFSLLASSLFLMDFPYQKYGNLVGVSVVASILLVSGLPIQTTQPDINGLYPLGDNLGLSLFFGLFLLVGTCNHLLSWWKDAQDKVPGNKYPGEKVPVMFLIWLIFLVGWVGELLFTPLAVALLIPGIVLLARRARDNLF